MNTEDIWHILENNKLCHTDGKQIFLDYYNWRSKGQTFFYRLNCPLLGRGAKFWQDGNDMWIDCWKEDLTDRGADLIVKVNKELELLLEKNNG